MVTQKKNSLLITQFDGLYQALSTQSIIDVFVIQGLILPADGEKIKAKYKNNLAIERFLLANKFISREAINKAYSIILKLPFIALRNLSIPAETLQILPERMGKKFSVIPFAKQNQVINLALGNPGELFLPQNRTLGNLFMNKGFAIELFVSTPTDILQAWSGSKNKNAIKLEKTNLPVIFLRNRNIDKKYLQMLPFDFVLKNRLAIFDQVSDKKYRIAMEDPYSSNTRKIIDYLMQNNSLQFEEFSTSKDDIDYLISLYGNGKAKIDSGNETNEQVKEQKEAGVFSGFLDNLIADNVPGLVSEEKINDDPSKTHAESVQHKQSVVEKNKLEIERVRQQEEEDKNIGKLLGKDIKNIDDLKKIVSEKSIPKLVAAIISYALSLGSSDIHIEPEAKRLRIRYRIDGILKDILQLPVDLDTQISSRVKILGTMKLDETRIPQDGRFSVNFMEREVDVRVSVLPTVFGEKIVLRILDKSQGVLSLEDLGFVGSAFKIVMDQLKEPHGIILATGPTGSGKSTTLYAIINRLNQPGVNVVTLEDPVEYEIAGINQCQIRPKIGFTFAEGLRSILRQDPNIIMVGEVRDLDTANMSTHAALTGHLVLSTLHTNDASSALPRLINMGIEPFLITSSLNLVIAQRLVRRICPKCREKVEVPAALMDSIKKEIANIPSANKEDLARVKEIQFYRGRGCSDCTEGFRGRIGIYELLLMNDEIENLAVNKRPASEIRDAAIKAGMLTMKQDGLLKVIDGLTTVDEVLSATGGLGVGEATIIARSVERQVDVNEENNTSENPIPPKKNYRKIDVVESE